MSKTGWIKATLASATRDERALPNMRKIRAAAGARLRERSERDAEPTRLRAAS